MTHPKTEQPEIVTPSGDEGVEKKEPEKVEGTPAGWPKKGEVTTPPEPEKVEEVPLEPAGEQPPEKVEEPKVE